jgi:hypothetical protein
MVRIKYYCETCDRNFIYESEALECENKHETYDSSTKLIISHQPHKEQTTLSFKISDELYNDILQKWNDTDRAMDFQHFLIKTFDITFRMKNNKREELKFKDEKRYCKDCKHLHNQWTPSLNLSPISSYNVNGYSCTKFACACKEIIP